MHALAAALVLAACAAKKASKVKATKPPNEYSTKNMTIAASPWRRKGAVFEEIGPGRFPCSTAWRCRFLTARRNQRGHDIAEK